MKTVIIAIAGASCSGKTSLADAVAADLGGSPNAIVVPLDAYYHDLSALEPVMRSTRNFDHPRSLDLDLFERDLGLLAAGRGALVPLYDFETHTRSPRETWRAITPLAPGSDGYIVVEGLHVLYRESMRARYDLAVFIDLDLDTCLSRRIDRDVRERGRTRESVTERFERMVRPMFEKYVLPCRRYADLLIDGESPPARSAAAVIASLGKRR